MVGLVKRAFNKTVGNGMLTWGELQDVPLDIEVTMNNRPLNNRQHINPQPVTVWPPESIV